MMKNREEKIFSVSDYIFLKTTVRRKHIRCPVNLVGDSKSTKSVGLLLLKSNAE